MKMDHPPLMKEETPDHMHHMDHVKKHYAAGGHMHCQDHTSKEHCKPAEGHKMHHEHVKAMCGGGMSRGKK
jgi:hypothetical protein